MTANQRLHHYVLCSTVAVASLTLSATSSAQTSALPPQPGGASLKLDFPKGPVSPAYQGMQPSLVKGAQDGPADGKPKVRHIYGATPDTIAIVVDAQFITNEPIRPYVKQPGDTLRKSQTIKYGAQGHEYSRTRQIVRNGVNLGVLVGGDEEPYLRPARRLVGEELNLAWADASASYRVQSSDDPNFATAQQPTQVFRKSKAMAVEWVAKPQGGSEEARTARHELYLRLPQPLKPGSRYTIRLNGDAQFGPELGFTFDDAQLRTEAIHVNQVGYHPNESQKIATLGMWLGSGGEGDLSKLREFRLVDEATGKIVLTGPIRATRRATPGAQVPLFKEPNPDPEALPLTVYSLDFSAFKTPGRYRISVPGLGCSFPFRIDRAVWADAARVSAKGFYNQRSGIEIGPPYSDYTLPRCMHPADGFPVHAVEAEIYNDPKRFPATTRVGNPFDRIQASILENTNNPNAWGGWHDAGDFDRSVLPQNHMRAVHAMLDLYESNPAFFERLNLNIPESKNAIPDILDEALWCMELFRRVQREDGAVPSAVESIEHPDEPCFLLTEPTALTPSTPQTCHIYAAAAAQMALNLAKYDAKLAGAYRTSAERAMAWAQANAFVPNIYARNEILPEHEYAALAAVSLYRLTGEAKWHEGFKAALAKAHPDGLKPDRNGFSGPYAETVYALLPADKTDAALQKQCRDALLAVANRKATVVENAPFGLDPRFGDWDKRLGDPWIFIVAHRLSGDARYLRVLAQSGQFALGNNLSNVSFTSGLGSRQLTTFHLNAYFTNQPIPAGITIMGPMVRSSWGSDKAEKVIAPRTFPEWRNWPWAESNFDVRYYAFTEYTVGGSMANQLLLRAYLAQAMN